MQWTAHPFPFRLGIKFYLFIYILQPAELMCSNGEKTKFQKFHQQLALNLVKISLRLQWL